MQEPDTTEDHQALWRCRQGDKQAFGIIVNKYMQRAYFSALGLVGNHDDALDLSQEAFVRAYQALVRFDMRQQFFTWYYRILRNLCLNHRRNHSKFVSLSSLQEVEAIDAAADPSIAAERREVREILWKALATLHREHREIIILKDLEGCSYKEIAARLDIPPGTVMSRLFNARRHLKEKLDERR